MRIARNVLLGFCLIVVGFFAGIWADWSEWLSVPAGRDGKTLIERSIVTRLGRDLYYSVGDFGTANLIVYQNDKIFLTQSNGGVGATMKFLGGYAPCAEGDGSATCTIDGSKPPGPYYFKCDSSNGYSCPDPGIQQTPTPGPGHYPKWPPTLTQAALGDIEHFFGGGTYFEANIPSSPPGPVGPGGLAPVTPSGPAGSAPVTATQPIGAYVVCNSSQKTEVDQLNANDPPADSSITAKKGQLISWVSPDNFTLAWVNAGLCVVPKPGGSPSNKAQCTVEPSSGTYHYTATSSVTGCAASKDETVVVN